ncbi:hypothetical protein [Streptomyces sp. NPDC059063]|uniref:hypothetical protein n=1 Tax=unclassified Streptomyces TaxID=2593676 RepID=UPI00369A44D2
MTHSTSRRRRTATLLAAAASLAVGLAASPANAAATWEPQPVPDTYVNMTLLPFDTQNAYARTQPFCWDQCEAPKLWQKSGSTWKELKPPADVAFDTLAGTGPNDLWAIGAKEVGDSLWHVHRYDGTKWSADLAPDTKKLSITDAEAVTKTSLWGAGFTRDNTDYYPTVTHYDGTKWNTKTFTDIDGSFDSIDVRSENDIWAVGSRTVGLDNYQPLAMHYDGTKWSEVPLPTTPGRRNMLVEVFSNGPTDVWVASEKYVWHGDGTTWTRQDAPASGRVTSFANYGGQVYAGIAPGDVRNPKLVRWNGTSWVTDTSLTNASSVHQLATTPDGSLYASYFKISSGNNNFISRLAPPAAR